jgi:hypothetical protein
LGDWKGHTRVVGGTVALGEASFPNREYRPDHLRSDPNGEGKTGANMKRVLNT